MCRFIAVTLLFSLCTATAPAVACSYNKLDLDYCGSARPSQFTGQPSNPGPVVQQPPIYKPDLGSGRSPSGPSTYPTVVTPRDSTGKTRYGPGVTHKF